MKVKIVFILLLVLPLVFIANTNSIAAPEADDEATAITYTYEADNPPAEMLAAREARAITSFNDIDMQGTAWQPQFRGHFQWAVKSYGVETKAASAWGGTYQWVHMAIPYPWAIDGTSVKIDEISVCMKSDYPSRSAPTKIELWSDTVVIYAGGFSWSTSNQMQCHTINLNPDEQRAYLGVSLLIKYYNSTDMVTLYGAWARFRP